MRRQLPIVTLKQIEHHFARGEQSLTLSRFESHEILALIEPAMATGAQLTEVQARDRTDTEGRDADLEGARARVTADDEMRLQGGAEKGARVEVLLRSGTRRVLQDLPKRLRHKWRTTLD